jgi:hypothetical protein
MECFVPLLMDFVSQGDRLGCVSYSKEETLVNPGQRGAVTIFFRSPAPKKSSAPPCPSQGSNLCW